VRSQSPAFATLSLQCCRMSESLMWHSRGLVLLRILGQRNHRERVRHQVFNFHHSFVVYRLSRSRRHLANRLARAFAWSFAEFQIVSLRMQ
jgi:hypothetical protein